MFARTFRRTVLGAAIALTLLVPAAQADDWARQSPLALDPALANAIRDAARASQPLPLDPALRNVLAEAASSSTRAAAPQATAADAFAWSDFGLGAGVAVASMLLLAGLATGARSRRQRHGANAGAATT